ncbi:response regulator [Scytonema tolypothrichoides VB-61278]|nr:response regulator [Scytonema tolypothrichoides VB-61278]
MLSITKDYHPKNDRDIFQYLEGLKVLVVDDDPDTRCLMTFILEDYGIRVMTAASALEALEVIKQFQPDILVSDIAMPYVDGYSLIRTIRSNYSWDNSIPAIAITAVGTEEGHDLAFKSGFQAYLIKPIEPDDLAELIVSLHLEEMHLEEKRSQNC